jgi:hypothetical protein
LARLHEGIKALPSVQRTKPVEQKVDLLQMLKKATTSTTTTTTTTTTAQQTVSSPPKDVGNDIFRVLTGHNNQYVKQHPRVNQYPTPTPPDNMATNYMSMPSEASEANSNNNMMNGLNNSMNHMDIHNENIPQRRVMANGELTKPFRPPFMNMSPAASPSNPNRNPGALLQALHGGLPPPVPPVFMGMPLMPQQVMGLMRPEVGRRFAGGPMLSKPEFIQQLLNMIQVNKDNSIDYTLYANHFS